MIQNKIPKIIHYCWFGGSKKTDLAEGCIKSWREKLPDYKIIEWNEDNFDISMNSYVEEAYKNKKYAFVSDYVRLYALYNYGGIYMDTDVQVIKKFDDLLLNELIWQGFDPEEIPFDTLPNKFVIKVTHGSTFNIICKNKAELDVFKTISLLKKWLKAKFLPCYGEWFYGVERPRIIVEKYLEDKSTRSLFDYKFFCFHGEPKLIYVDTWKDNNHAINVYDTNFNLLPNVKLGYENDLTTEISKPDNFEEMLEYAKKLSKDFLHVRVDFYNVNGKVIFGELTFTKGAGFGKISPHSFDIEMGSWLRLPIEGK